MKKVSIEAISPLQVLSGIRTATATAQAASDALRDATSQSLIEYTREARVEPLILIDDSIAQEPYMKDLCDVVMTMFGGYYLQAIAMMTDIGGVSVRQRLDRLSPNRSLVNTTISTAIGVEDFTHALPSFSPKNVSVENQKPTDTAMSRLRSNENLATGRLVDVKIVVENNNYVMPIMFRLVPLTASPNIIVDTFSINSRKETFKERWHRWKAGELSLIGDLILLNDMVKKHRNNLINDKSGFYAETTRRRRGNTLSALISGNPSIATASNTVVMSLRTAKRLELAIAGQLNHFATRQQVFDLTGLMFMVIVDPDREWITIYHRSIKTPTEVSIREIKQRGDKDLDMKEILQAFMDNKAPSF